MIISNVFLPSAGLSRDLETVSHHSEYHTAKPTLAANRPHFDPLHHVLAGGPQWATLSL